MGEIIAAGFEPLGLYPGTSKPCEADAPPFAIEQEALARIRRDYDPNYFMSPETMPQGVWTETFDAELL